MAFTVEDGTSKPDANAYMTVQEVIDHHLDRGIDLSGEPQTLMETSIVNATDYMDKRWGALFRGEKRESAQGLEWPRTNAYDDDGRALNGMVSELLKGCAEYTYLVLQLGRNLAPLPPPEFGILDPATGEVTNLSGGKVLERAEEVGPIKERTKYSEGAYPRQPIPDYPQADMWMAGITVGTSSREMVLG